MSKKQYVIWDNKHDYIRLISDNVIEVRAHIFTWVLKNRGYLGIDDLPDITAKVDEILAGDPDEIFVDTYEPSINETDILLKTIAHEINQKGFTQADGESASHVEIAYNNALEDARQIVLSYMDNTQGLGYNKPKEEQ